MEMFFLPIGLQGVAMIIDEFYFHHKRGLQLWERVGHPLDTISVLICYVFIIFQNPSPSNINIYIGLCAFSCLLITKDEFIHTEKCEASENWLHAILFILHPIAFMAAGYIWITGVNPTFIILQPLIIFVFLMYQIIYWGFYGKSK